MAGEWGSATGTPVLSSGWGTGSSSLTRPAPTSIRVNPPSWSRPAGGHNRFVLSGELRTTGIGTNHGDPTIFMSWGAVLYIQGPPPEVRCADRQGSIEANGRRSRTHTSSPARGCGTGHPPTLRRLPVTDGGREETPEARQGLRRLCYEVERTTLRACWSWRRRRTRRRRPWDPAQTGGAWRKA